MVDFTRFMPPGGLPLDIKFPTPVPVGVSPPPAVQPAPVKPPRGDAIKVPIKQPPLPLPGESGPIIANPGVPPIPMPPVEPQIPMPAPVPQVPAPAPVPQPAPMPIPEPPMPAPVPQVPAPMPMPAPMPEPVFSIPTPVPQPAPEPILPPSPPPPPPVAAPLPPAPPVNELPPPIQVPPPINVPAPPDDIVSRGTVGPVAPPPVEVPPPVMQPTPEPVAPTPQRADPPPAIFDPGPVPPPIPLAPSQPGVPTPMAPGSFQGVLPGPQPEPEAPPVELPPMMAVDPEPGVLPTFGRVDDPRLAQVQPVAEEPTGIETMAPSVGFGDYLGNEVAEAMPSQPAQQDTIALPDGSSFDLSTLDIGGFTGEGFDITDISLGQTPAQPAPAQSAPVEEGTGFDPAGRFQGEGFDFELPVDDSGNPDFNALVNSGQTAGPAGPVVVTDYFQLHDALGSGLSLDQIDTSNLSGFDPANIGQDRPTDSGGFNPEDYTSPAGEFMTDGQLAEYGSLEPGTPIPDNPTNTGLTPEQQAALDEYLANNPGAFDFIGSGFNPFGGMSGVGSFGSIPSGTVSDGQGSYTVIPVGPVGDLDNTGGQAPAPGPINVRSASSYGLTGAQPTMPISDNPFRRPETQGGIGSLAGGG